jgi:hypothetical protein
MGLASVPNPGLNPNQVHDHQQPEALKPVDQRAPTLPVLSAIPVSVLRGKPMVEAQGVHPVPALSAL